MIKSSKLQLNFPKFNLFRINLFDSTTSSGLALSQIFGIANQTAGMMYSFMLSLSLFSSVERLMEYIKVTDFEDDWDKTKK